MYFKKAVSQRVNTRRHIYAQIYSIQWFFNQPIPLLPVLALTCPPLYMTFPLFLLTWRISFFCLRCEYPSTLVPGLLSTVLTLLLHPPQGTPQIKLHIYIDDISNVSCPVWHNKYWLLLLFLVCESLGHLIPCSLLLCGTLRIPILDVGDASLMLSFVQDVLCLWVWFWELDSHRQAFVPI